MTLEQIHFEHKDRLTADQWRLLFNLDNVNDLVGNSRYFVGEYVDNSHTQTKYSQEDYNQLSELENDNIRLLDNIIGYFQRGEWERFDEVASLIEEEVKEAIDKSEEILDLLD